MFYVLDTYSRHGKGELIIHRAYPNPCTYLPEHKYQINLGNHEDALKALYAAKKMFPAKRIEFCSRCYGYKRDLTAEERNSLVEIFK